MSVDKSTILKIDKTVQNAQCKFMIGKHMTPRMNDYSRLNKNICEQK